MADKKKSQTKTDAKGQKSKKSVLPRFVTKIEIKNLKFKLLVTALVCVFLLGSYFIVAGVQSYYKIRYEGPIVTGLRALEQGKHQKAMAVLLRSANKGNKVAAMYMAWIEGKRGNFRRSLEYIRQTSEDPEMTGGFEILGDLALLGYGQAIGAGPALFYFNEALKQYPEEERESAMRLMLERAIGLCLNLNDYIRIINEAVQRESPIAKLLRGDIEFLGEEEGALSPASANKSWDGADADGITEAMVRKAGAFWHGYAEPRNYEQAIRLYKEASKQGNPGAIYSEGLITMRIKQVGAFEQGFSLFQKSADLGYAPAMTAVAALSLARNRQDPDTIANALKLFKKAHELGDYTASIYYSLMLYNGVGTEADINHALSILFDLKDHDIVAVNGFMDFLTYVTNESLMPVLDQLLELNYLQFLGELHFISGAPEARVYEDKDRDLGFFTPPYEDKNITEGLKDKLDNNYIAKVENPDEVEINGEPLIVPEFAYALSQSEPSTQAKRFIPPLVTSIGATLPPLPLGFGEYGLDMELIAKAFDPDFKPKVAETEETAAETEETAAEENPEEDFEASAEQGQSRQEDTEAAPAEPEEGIIEEELGDSGADSQPAGGDSGEMLGAFDEEPQKEEPKEPAQSFGLDEIKQDLPAGQQSSELEGFEQDDEIEGLEQDDSLGGLEDDDLGEVSFGDF
ncbi:MAG: sel1 repeat family protein [Succinivibrio sp.]|nr:sel1 repeat family protein [Succinivibrio sp.]